MIKGSCACGRVRFEIDAARSMTHCHCVNCRKLTAASVATYVHVEKDKFRWLAGEDNSTPMNRRRAAFASSAGPAAQWFRAKPPISRQ